MIALTESCSPVNDLVDLWSFWSVASVIQNTDKLCKVSVQNVSSNIGCFYVFYVNWKSSSYVLRRYLSWRRCFCGFLFTYRFSLHAVFSPRHSKWRTPKAWRFPGSLQFLRTLLWRSHPLCPSRNLSAEIFFFSPLSTVFCRVSALLATLHRPLGLISVRTRLPSLPLRAPCDSTRLRFNLTKDI